MADTRKKVLLVEDDPLLVKMYLAKFETDGFEIKNAGDGEEGLKLALSGWPDLIVLDIMMPKLSGTDMLLRLKQDPNWKEVPILILSNLSQQEEAKKALSLGVKEYLIKADYTPSQIIEKIKYYLK